MPRKQWSVLLSSNYRPNSVRFSVPLWFVRVLFAAAAVLALAVVAALVLLFSGGLRLGRLAYLEARNRQLEAEHGKVVQLRRQLDQLDAEARKMAVMLGVNKTPPPVNWDSVAVDSGVLPEWLTSGAWGVRPVPVIVPVEAYAVSQGMHPNHDAIDLAAKEGEPVRSTADGVVEQRGTDRDLGRFLLLRHSRGFESYYGHLQDWNVDKGDTVRAGQTIGWVGSTGKSTAPHLHFEIRKDGKAVDPASILKF